MANFKEAYKKLVIVEYSNRADLFLHKNKNESGYTLGGIYSKYHANSIDWDFVSRIVQMCDFNLKEASKLLFKDKEIQRQVLNVFKKGYWDKNKLDDVESQIVAEEIFLFGVHTGAVNAAKTAQKLAGVLDDGIIGQISIKALNRFNENKFSKKFDEMEMDYYIKNSRQAYMKGFEARSQYV